MSTKKPKQPETESTPVSETPKTKAKAVRLSSEEKQKIVDDCNASGKSMKKYAEENNLDYNNLRNWVNKATGKQESKKPTVDKSALEQENEKLKRRILELVLRYEPDSVLKHIL